MPNDRKDLIQPLEASFDDVAAKMVAPLKKPRSDVLKALKTGSFWDILDLEVECYVLNDKDKTAVISQQGLQWLFDEKTLSNCVGRDTMERLYQPITFQGESGLPKFGYNAEILTDVCLSILDPKHKEIDSIAAYRAFSILRLAAKIGIAEVVYKACKYKKTSK